MTLALDRCYLCGQPSAFVGVFEPREPWNYCPFPPAPGKVRRLLYGVCKPCMDGLGTRELAARVEAKLKAEVAT